jgi:lipopolysaccharide/colanic/teichoic acid biosynthesis glycosyltransferase
MSERATAWQPQTAAPKRDHLFYHSLKRFLDIVIASSAILILLPIMIAVALAIAIEDGRPFVYHQLRTGRFGQSFRFYKFRSMVRNADKVKAELQAHNEASGPIFKMKNDPRVTRTGRFIRRTSLDELPQFFSVLRGEMSLIGPRPLYAPEASKLDVRHGQRHKVQPGLLCLREVCGRSELTFEQWMELDLIYVESQSLRTDLTIMLRAIPAILSSHGAY